MIIFLCMGRHRYALNGWLRDYHDDLQGKVRILAYERLWGRIPKSSYVFTDLERLDEFWTGHALQVYSMMKQAGLPVFNHPTGSMRRYSLQMALSNDFRVFRSSDDLTRVRYPVFLKGEADHDGPLTPLIRNVGELGQALTRHPDALIVEFLDTSDADGVFRKYSYFRVGRHLMPAHMYCGTHWMVKVGTADRDHQQYLKEELAFVQENPHEREVWEAFELAKIEYGRIDYSVHSGKLQVFEINTNPHTEGESWEPTPERKAIKRLLAQTFNRALLELDTAHPGSGTIRLSYLPVRITRTRLRSARRSISHLVKLLRESRMGTWEFVYEIARMVVPKWMAKWLRSIVDTPEKTLRGYRFRRSSHERE
jgi:hypothetical protein